jgi:hypothetical protein
MIGHRAVGVKLLTASPSLLATASQYLITNLL